MADTVSAADTIRVVCPHGEVATFTRLRPGGRWAPAVSRADPDVRRDRWLLRCERCRINAPMGREDQENQDRSDMTKAQQILDAFFAKWPRRDGTSTVEIPLKAVADALGRAAPLDPPADRSES